MLVDSVGTMKTRWRAGRVRKIGRGGEGNVFQANSKTSERELQPNLSLGPPPYCVPASQQRQTTMESQQDL